MDLQTFFESTTGKIVTVVVTVLMMLVILLMGRKDRKDSIESKSLHFDTLSLTISAVLIASSFVLSMFTMFRMPQGGTVTPFSMLPIAVVAYLLGTRTGVMAGTSLGLINLIVNPYVIHPLQLLLDYPIAFASLGIGGFARDTKAGLPLVYLIGIFGRFICSTASGVIFFASYAEGTGMNPLLYSVVYNGTYIGAEGAITILILLLPPVKAAMARLKEQLTA